jgi:hypothetical protein
MDGSVAVSVEVSVGASAILTLSADGFHGCRGGGGPTRLMGFHIIDFLGAHFIQHTRIHGMVTDLTGDTNRRMRRG